MSESAYQLRPKCPDYKENKGAGHKKRIESIIHLEAWELGYLRPERKKSAYQRLVVHETIGQD